MLGCPGPFSSVVNGSFSRMLKQAINCVLVSRESSTYPRGYASGSCVACGLTWDKARLGAPGLEGEKAARLSIR